MSKLTPLILFIKNKLCNIAFTIKEMVDAKVMKQINFVVVIDYKKYIKVTDWLAVNYHNIQLSDWWLLFLNKFCS